MWTTQPEKVIISEGQFIESSFPEINRADINLSQLRKNIEIIRGKLSPEVKFMAVAKGDAYGHGLVPIAHELERCKCDAIGIVRLTEAITLREAGITIPIMMMSPLMPVQAYWAVKYNISPMVDNERIIAALEKSAIECEKYVNIHIKINTGLNRYGVEYSDALDFIKMVRDKYPHIKIEGVYTHFKDAENDTSFTYLQLDRFKQILRELEDNKIRPAYAHASGSAGILMYPESHMDMVRCGLILYGLEHKDGENLLPEGVKPIMTLRSRILKIEEIKAGHSGGYGNKFIATRNSKIAIVGIGYADGVSRGWKEVLISGKRCPAVNHFMDGVLVDITDVNETVNEYDEVVIVGKQRDEAISWEEACGGINAAMDEQFQRITERVPKHYYY